MDIPRVLTLTSTKFVAVGAATFSIGAGISYLVTRRYMEEEYRKIIAKELEETKAFYNRLYKKDEFSDPTELVKEYENVVAINNYASLEDDKSASDEVTLTLNHPLSDKNFNFPEEEALRGHDKPYVIHHDEFMENLPENDQTTMTFYEEDGVLVDERDEPVEDIERVVGEANLRRFGHGSKAHNVVYIRNPLIGLDIEVLQNNRSDV